MSRSRCVLASIVLAFAMCILAEGATRPRNGDDLNNDDCLVDGSCEMRPRAASLHAGRNRDRPRHPRQQHVSNSNVSGGRGSWAPREQCGRRNIKYTSITHGHQTRPKEWPFLVRVVALGSRDKDDCGGTIIDNNRILTSAHCIKQGFEYNVELNVPNDVNLCSSFPVKSICKARKYTEGSIEHDWAVLYLNKSSGLKYNDWAQPACMPDKNPIELTPDTVCWVVGFGLYDTPDGLKQAPFEPARHLPVKHVPCPMQGPAQYETNMCFGSANPSGSPCFGDSGGPVLCRSRGRWTVVAMVTGGTDRKCELPVAYYMNVRYIIPGIESQCAGE